MKNAFFKWLRRSLYFLLLVALTACAGSASAPAATRTPAPQPSKAILEEQGFKAIGPFEVFFKGDQQQLAHYDGTVRIATTTSGSYALEPGVAFVEGCAHVKGTEYNRENKELVLLITSMEAMDCPTSSSP